MGYLSGPRSVLLELGGPISAPLGALNGPRTSIEPDAAEPTPFIAESGGASRQPAHARRAPTFARVDRANPAVRIMDGVKETATFRVKAGLAEMLKGGVIMDVVTADQARIAESAGAAAVMALERVPADIRAAGGVARMADPTKIEEIQGAVTIPVMAKARIGHFVEAQVLEALEVDYVDESEVLTPADEANHIDKWKFKVPFVCGATDLGEALRRISEGAAMIRTKGEAAPRKAVGGARPPRQGRGASPPAPSRDE